MKKLTGLLVGMLCASSLMAERIVNVPFGDMETWTVRHIKESKIIGGKVRTLYAIAPTDTIEGNIPYKYGKNGNPWSMSDAYAVVAGIHKAAGTVSPEKRGNGYCCHLDVKMLDVVVMGMINIHVLVNGTVFWGQTLEPVTTAKDPYQNIDFGIPFTDKPKALLYDYKCIVSPERWIWRATGLTAAKKIEGHDECEVYMFLQKRWEDADGNIHSIRVGTAYERYSQSVTEWQNNHRLPVHYGDITGEPWYKDYMGLCSKPERALNSKGKMVYINEEGWDGDATPTHAVLMITSGCYHAFYGHDGNGMWVDNVRLVYND